MSTRSQRFKSETERAHAKHDAQPSAAAPPPPDDEGAKAKNATYAREEIAAGARPSRRSTRKSANHARTDTGEVRAEQMKQATPANQARRNRAAAHGVRAAAASGRTT